MTWRLLRCSCGAFLATVLFFYASTSSANPVPQGLVGQLIVGYQGWFGCPGDFEGNTRWQHWFDKDAQPEHFTVDLLPALRGINVADTCDTGLRRDDGSAIRLYSAQNKRVVATHFGWMKTHGIDGAAVQRFVSELPDSKMKRRSDNVIKNVQLAAESSGRTFYVTYDVTGANTKTVVADIRRDWRHLVNDLKITASPNYLRDHGKPVLQLWGFGFKDRPGTPEEVGALIDDLRAGRGETQAVYLVGGVPTYWRTLSGDAKPAAAWAAVYRSYDVISPWSVGRYADDAGANAFVRDLVIPDMAQAKRLGLGYMPVMFPGFSWYNLVTNRAKSGRAILNQTPRRCGKFLWRQVSNLLNAQATMLYLAMFDEVDEGTAVFPVEAHANTHPPGVRMVSLDQDGCALPEDWYLRVAGKAARYLHANLVAPADLDAVLQP